VVKTSWLEYQHPVIKHIDVAGSACLSESALEKSWGQIPMMALLVTAYKCYATRNQWNDILVSID